MLKELPAKRHKVSMPSSGSIDLDHWPIAAPPPTPVGLMHPLSTHLPLSCALGYLKYIREQQTAQAPMNLRTGTAASEAGCAMTVPGDEVQEAVEWYAGGGRSACSWLAGPTSRHWRAPTCLSAPPDLLPIPPCAQAAQDPG